MKREKVLTTAGVGTGACSSTAEFCCGVETAAVGEATGGAGTAAVVAGTAGGAAATAVTGRD